MVIEVLVGPDWSEDLLKIVSSYNFSLAEVEQQKKNLVYELLENGDNRTFFLGKIGATPVAMAQVIHNNADNDPELANGKNISHVHGLRVNKDFSRKGLGRGMMEFIEEYSRSHGQIELTLGVDDWNPPALSLYSSMGYEKFKEEPGRTPEEFLFLLKKSL